MTKREKAIFDANNGKLCHTYARKGYSEQMCQSHNPYTRYIKKSKAYTKVDKDNRTILQYAIKAWEVSLDTGRPQLRENWADLAYARPQKGKSASMSGPIAGSRPRPKTEGERQARTTFARNLPYPRRLATSGLGRLCA